MNCLEDETIHDFVHGELAAAALDMVDAHLDSCTECRGLVAAIACGSDADGQEAAGSPFGLRRGANVGRYLLLEAIGQGAMGVVFSAYDPDLHRRVAIKVLRQAEGQGTTERLLREAQAMARLSDPNVVTLYEAGQFADSVFLAMELVEGQTLRLWMQEGSHSWSAVLEVFLQAARGLAAAHRAELVHRDFKPENVLVGEDGRARVTDFGLARGLAFSGEDAALLDLDPSTMSQTMTRTGLLVGTPAYMAPEQLRGQEASASSDQYAFCVALYEALYGQRPFVGTSIAELLEAAEKEPPIFVRKQVPRWLQSVLERGLHPEPGERHVSMDALIEGLAHAPTRSRWTAVFLGAGATATIGIALAWNMGATTEQRAPVLCASAVSDFDAVWSSERQAALTSRFDSGELSAQRAGAALGASLSRWRQEWIDESTGTCQATQVKGIQSEALMDLKMQCLQRGLTAFVALTEELTATSGPSNFELAAIESALPEIAACRDTESLLGVQPPTAAQALEVDALLGQGANARALLAVGRYDAARQAAVEAQSRAVELGYAPTISSLSLLLAEIERHRGAIESSRLAIETAIVAAMAARSERDLVQAWIESVAIAGEAGQLDQGLEHARFASTTLDRLEQADALVATLANNWGIVYYRMGRYSEARPHLERALALRKGLLGNKNALVARSLTNLGNLERVSGRLQAALGHHREALAMDTAVLGDRHPAIGRHLHNIAGVMRLQGQRKEALAIYEQALALRTEVLGPTHQDVALTLNSLGLIHYELGDLDKARQYYERSLASYPDATHPDRALSLHGLGLIEITAGEHSSAQLHLRDALAVFENRFDDSHERVSTVLLALAESLLATGDRRQALYFVQRARDAGNADHSARVAELLARSEPGGREPGKPPKVVPVLQKGGQTTGMYGSSPAWD